MYVINFPINHTILLILRKKLKLEFIYTPIGDLYKTKKCKKIVSDYQGTVPDTMEGLTSLRGVARKTANVILSNAFNKREGIIVDTHVKRLSRRLGLTTEKDPVKIEKDLMAIIPRDEWLHFANLLLYHGRAVCTAQNPACSTCILCRLCPSRRNMRKNRFHLPIH